MLLIFRRHSSRDKFQRYHWPVLVEAYLRALEHVIFLLRAYGGTQRPHYVLIKHVEQQQQCNCKGDISHAFETAKITV